tara:strand:+ start:837 stop:1484 length:648 start_codon:yes stop_codon:yes gene_type:complete
MAEWKEIITRDKLVDQGSNSLRISQQWNFSWQTSTADRNSDECRLVYPNFETDESDTYSGTDYGSSLGTNLTVKPEDINRACFFRVPWGQILPASVHISVTSSAAHDNSDGMSYRWFTHDANAATLGDSDWDSTTDGPVLIKRGSKQTQNWTSIGHATGGGYLEQKWNWPVGFGGYAPERHTGFYIVFQENRSGTATKTASYQANMSFSYYVTEA